MATTIDKLAHISVKDPQFGATGDGSTDDAAAIQAAIDYAQSIVVSRSRGATVWFPHGHYMISVPLITNGTINISGSQRASRIRALAGFPETLTVSTFTFPAPMLFVDASGITDQSIQVDNLFLDCDDVAQSGVVFSRGANHYVQNVRVENAALDGIVVDGSQNYTFVHCRANRSSRYGFRIMNGVGWINFFSCFTRYAGDANVAIESSDSNYKGSVVGGLNTDVFWVGGILEDQKDGFTRKRALFVGSGAQRTRFLGVNFYAPCAAEFVKIEGHLTLLDHCSWSGGNADPSTVPALRHTGGQDCEVIKPHINNFSATNTIETNVNTRGLKVTEPRLSSVNASGKDLAWTGGTAPDMLRSVVYEPTQRAGLTGQRPSMSKIDAVAQYWDNGLKKPIWWDPLDGVWRDALGGSV